MCSDATAWNYRLSSQSVSPPNALSVERRAQGKMTLTYTEINKITHAIFTASLKAYADAQAYSTTPILLRYLT